MNSLLKPSIFFKTTLLSKSTLSWKSHPDKNIFAQLLLLCCFVACLTVTTSLILTSANSNYAKEMAVLSIYDDNATQGLVNVDGIYADAENIDRQVRVDVILVKEQVQYEQKLADLGFVLQQYAMMELQAFKFVIDMPKREQVTAMMLTHLQNMLTEFTALNPDINANWQVDPNNALQLIVQLHTERERSWASANFNI